MSEISTIHVVLYCVSVFLASISQVFLKKAALRTHKSIVAEYIDPYLIAGYTLFIGCTMLTMLAYRGIPMNFGAILEASGYIYISIFGVTLFREKMSGKKILALVMILAGIVMYSV